MLSTQALPGPLHLLLLASLAASLIHADITNRTIDDTKGDPITSQRVSYLPTSGVWNTIDCPRCTIKPDPVQAFSGTWTDATYFKQSHDPINATMSFTGTAIYIFFIVVNNIGPGIVTKTAANITLDNQLPRLFEHNPDMSRNDLQYNVLAFSQTNLQNVYHSLVISVSGLQQQIFINFDYAIYTHEDVVVPPIMPIIHSTPSPPAGAIAGGVVGGLLVIGLLIIGLLFIRRRRRENDKHDNRNRVDAYGSEAKERSFPGHRRDASNTTTVVPFPLSKIQFSDTKTASDRVSSCGAMMSTNSGATVAHSRKGWTEDLRRTRQEELEQRLQASQQEMREILDEINRHEAGQPPRRPPLPVPDQQERTQSQSTSAGWGSTVGEARYNAAPTDDEMTVDELKENLRDMREQVEYLRQQQQSAWAQGLSDEPPPGYSAITRGLSLRRSQS